jgi:hypothetical protein
MQRKTMVAAAMMGMALPVHAGELPVPKPRIMVCRPAPKAKATYSPLPKLVGYVQKANPKLNRGRAIKIARLLEAKAKEHKVPLRIFAAIVKQESTFRPGIKVCHGGRTCDYGLGQINQLWIREWDLDPHRLQHDDEYNLDTSARILSKAIRAYGKKDPKAYSRYHDSRPDRRLVYEQLVERWIPKA